MIRLNFTVNFGGILVMTFPLRSQVFSSVCLMRWYTASGTCINWHSDKSENKKILTITKNHKPTTALEKLIIEDDLVCYTN